MSRIVAIIGLISLVFLSSCYEEENFSDVPRVEFRDVVFRDSELSVDTLQLSFYFEDGDADFGLAEDDNLPPFHNYEVLVDSLGIPIPLDSDYDGSIFTIPYVLETFIYSLRNGDGVITRVEEAYGPVGQYEPFAENGEALQELDRCDFVSIFYYQIVEVGENREDLEYVEDDVYAFQNERGNNLFVTFEFFDGNEFVEFDFQEIFQSDDCELGNFDAKVPVFDPEGRSGTITYNLISLLFVPALQDNIVRIKITVLDRAGNRSNVAYSPEFRLSEITQ